MERYTAERITEAVDRADKALNYLGQYVRAVEDAVERKRMLKLIGLMLCDLDIEIARTIRMEYSDLDLHPPNDVREPPKPS
jgi:hypothetical protein